MTSASIPRQGTAVRRDVFRGFMAEHAAGVCVITTTTATGEPVGMTCSSLVSVAVEPPIVSVSLSRDSDTLQELLARRGFAVNLLHEGGVETARRFAAEGVERFAGVSWSTGTAGFPWLHADANAVADCRVEQRVEIADHVIVLARVQRVRLLVSRPPLAYVRRRYAVPGDADAAEPGHRSPAARGA